MIYGKVTVQVTKTADGKGDYIQIMSADMLSINVVVVAQEIVLSDKRAVKPRGRGKR